MTNLVSWSLVAVLCGVTGMIVAVLQLLQPDSRICRRIDDQIRRRRRRPQESDHDLDQTTDRRVWGDRLVAAWLPKEHQAVRLRQRLSYAGYYRPSAVATFVSLQLALILLFGTFMAWLCNYETTLGIDWRPAFCVGAGLGYLIPTAWLHRQKRYRLTSLRRSLPDLLDLMVSCLDAGLSLEAVIKKVADEKELIHEHLSDELQRVQREIELGASPDRAFQTFAQRTDSEEIRALSVVCLQARKYGARVSSTLRTHADTLRDQREQLAEEAAQKAAVKILAPTLLCLFPVIFIVLAGPAAFQIHENLTSQSGQATTEE